VVDEPARVHGDDPGDEGPDLQGLTILGTDALLRAALAAAARGWSVVPLHDVERGACSCGRAACGSPGKHPRVPWRDLMERRAGAEEIRAWWRELPTANVGVVTGAVSGLLVLDVDVRRGGDDELAAAEAGGGRIGPTPVSLTSGGGRHLWLAHPGGIVPSRPIGPGLDVEGEGGLVVAPPSRHVSGHRYGWMVGAGPERACAPAPAWVAGAAPLPQHQLVGAPTLRGDVTVPVYGEADSQGVLRRIAADRLHDRGIDLTLLAELVPEGGRRRKGRRRAAIAVRIAGHRVGTLPNRDAVRLWHGIDQVRMRSGRATCAATLRGGWLRPDGTRAPIGVTVHVPGR
jgi:hypothetical protein